MSAPHESEYHHGSMDMNEHRRSYAGFLAFTKYALAGIFIVMALLAIFRTHG
jgi:hypothetical protein